MTDLIKPKPRILVVDDDSSILDAYKNILGESSDQDESDEELGELYSKLFNKEKESDIRELEFELDMASQGKDAVRLITEAKHENRPYAVVFLDMRMPPGQDGFVTAKQIRKFDTDCNIVIVTAYTDIEVSEMAAAIKPADKFFYIRKPFFHQEIQQFAVGLAAKWQAESQLNEILEERLHRLAQTNIALHEEMDTRQEIEEELEKYQGVVGRRDDELETIKKTIDFMFRKKIDASKEVEENILYNVNNQIRPLIKQLKDQPLNQKGKKSLALLSDSIDNITSPFISRLSIQSFRLTSDEMSVAQLISQGMTSKVIGETLGISKRTIDFHREQIRKKLNLHNQKKSLKKMLMDLRTRSKD